MSTHVAIRLRTTRAIVFLSVIMAAIALAIPGYSQQTSEQTPPVPLEELLGKLQQGGYVLIIRHERTELPSRPDDYSRAPDDCTAQRNLSLAGFAGARETGFVMRALDIDVGRVISSPMCRSAETARYMFGVGYETDKRLMHHDPKSARNLDIAEGEVRELLRKLAPVAADTNIALITHGGTIVRVSGLRLSEGEVGVLKLSETGEIEAVGQFMGSDLSPYARRIFQAQE